QLVCVPFGTCEPCPENARHEPFCKPFGNRRLMHCFPASTSPSSHPDPSQPHARPPGSQHGPDTQPQTDHRGEIPAWESCGRIVANERGDFYEFLACNLAVALLALAVVFVRSKRLQAMQARQLAARIGLVRPTPEGWAAG
ncbi:hypothetical protein PHLGIDRAFT_62982, partial [Phlebiopsis gigantea 11061_1 CR5-6]